MADVRLKVSGPGWLTVSKHGVLARTPDASVQGGTQQLTIRAAEHVFRKQGGKKVAKKTSVTITVTFAVL